MVPTIAIVGGGFSGCLTAVNLARLSHIPLRVLLVNSRQYPLGRGIAYGTRQAEHLLNVAARNMSALADHPNHFVDWLRTRYEYQQVPEASLRETFVPRRVYGDYLRGLLQAYAVSLTRHNEVQIEIVESEVVDIEDVSEGRVEIQLSPGEKLLAECVVLALGNQPPAEFGGDQAFRHPHYCENPWIDWSDRLPDKSETVVLLGTGLTTVDALLTLLSQGWQGTIYAVSRHGLLPQSHFRGIEYPEFPPADPSQLRLSELVSLIEEHCQRLRRMGANPAMVVDKLRPFTQKIWKRWSLEEKKQFIDEYAARWNVTRHRIAPGVYQQLKSAREEERLKVVQGTVTGLEAAGNRIRVTVVGEAAAKVVLEAGLVVNGTGPRSRLSQTANPLLQRLLEQQRLTVDPLDMGIAIDDRFQVIKGQEKAGAPWYAIGPLLKGTLWETIAVPELRGQALNVAQNILQHFGGDRPRLVPWPSSVEYELLEYCI
jgi:uncharacterized NAD(P)/FAD-binding protein YdhS